MQKRLPIFYSALLLTGVNLLLRFVGTSFQVYLSGRIGAAGIGLLQLTMSVSSMAMVAGMAGIRTATMYLTAEKLGKKRPEHITQVLSSCFLYSILCSGTVAAGLIVFAPQIARDWIGNAQITDALRLAAALVPVNCLTGVMVGYFTGANRIATLAAVEVAEQLCSMVATLALLAFWSGDIPERACQAVIGGSGIGSCLTLLCLALLRIREKGQKGAQIPTARRLLGIAVPLALADDLKTGINTVENLMVPKRLALCAAVENPLAAFGMLSGMVFPVLMFPAALLFGLAELLIPELARCRAAGSSGRISYLVQRSLRIAMFYGVLFSGWMFLLAKPLCLRLYGNTDAGGTLQLYALLVPMLYCDAITDAMVKGLGQQKASVRYNIITSAMDVALLFVLLPRYGMQGYFFSFALTHMVNFLLSIRRLLKISGEAIRLYVPMLTAAGALAAGWAASHLRTPLSMAAAYPVLLVCTLYLLGIINRQDILWVRSLIRPKKVPGH